MTGRESVCRSRNSGDVKATSKREMLGDEQFCTVWIFAQSYRFQGTLQHEMPRVTSATGDCLV